MAEVGNHGVSGGSLYGPVAGDNVGARFQMPEGGTITKVWGRLQAETTTGDLAVAIYSVDGSNLINVKLGNGSATNEVTTTEKWCGASLGAGVHLNNGEYFFANVWPSVSHLIRYDSGGASNQLFGRWDQSWPTWLTPDPHTGGYYTSTEILWIYVEYTSDNDPSLKKLFIRKGLRPALFKPGNSR